MAASENRSCGQHLPAMVLSGYQEPRYRYCQATIDLQCTSTPYSLLACGILQAHRWMSKLRQLAYLSLVRTLEA